MSQIVYLCPNIDCGAKYTQRQNLWRHKVMQVLSSFRITKARAARSLTVSDDGLYHCTASKDCISTSKYKSNVVCHTEKEPLWLIYKI